MVSVCTETLNTMYVSLIWRIVGKLKALDFDPEGVNSNLGTGWYALYTEKTHIGLGVRREETGTAGYVQCATAGKLSTVACP